MWQAVKPVEAKRVHGRDGKWKRRRACESMMDYQKGRGFTLTLKPKLIQTMLISHILFILSKFNIIWLINFILTNLFQSAYNWECCFPNDTIEK